MKTFDFNKYSRKVVYDLNREHVVSYHYVRRRYFPEFLQWKIEGITRLL